MEEMTMDYIFPYSGKTIEETLKSSFFAASVSATATGMAITYGTNEKNVVLALPVATNARAGIVTASTMMRLSVVERNVQDITAKVEGTFDAMPPVPQNVVQSIGETYRMAFVDSSGNELFAASIGQATPKTSGLMSAADKKKLASMQKTFFAKKVENVLLQGGGPLIGSESGILCFDTKKNKLLLEVGGRYYTTWGIFNDPNNMGDVLYKTQENLISVEGTVYAWSGEKWVSIGGGALKRKVLSEAEFQALDGSYEEGVLYLTY